MLSPHPVIISVHLLPNTRAADVQVSSQLQVSCTANAQPSICYQGDCPAMSNSITRVSHATKEWLVLLPDRANVVCATYILYMLYRAY